MLVDLQITPPGRLRALFRLKQSGNSLIELSINPVERRSWPTRNLRGCSKQLASAGLLTSRRFLTTKANGTK
jgi:hypothetical protein